MSHTRVGGPAVRLEGRPDPPGTIGDGGLGTSVSDLARWLQACNAAAFGFEVQRPLFCAEQFQAPSTEAGSSDGQDRLKAKR